MLFCYNHIPWFFTVFVFTFVHSEYSLKHNLKTTEMDFRKIFQSTDWRLIFLVMNILMFIGLSVRILKDRYGDSAIKSQVSFVTGDAELWLEAGDINVSTIEFTLNETGQVLHFEHKRKSITDIPFEVWVGADEQKTTFYLSVDEFAQANHYSLSEVLQWMEDNETFNQRYDDWLHMRGDSTNEPIAYGEMPMGTSKL